MSETTTPKTTNVTPTADKSAAAKPSAKPRSSTSAAKPIAKKPVTTSSASKAVAKTATPAKTAVVKAKAAPAKKSSIKLPKPKKAKAEKAKPEKIKMERDSFTMPKDEYAQLTLLKARLSSMGQPAKKSELLRAGVKLLAAMSDNTLKTTLAKIPVIKTGRPKKKN